jgi:alcohol dehydrogenase YqhD (iron-dependent ADH family)
MDDFEFYNNTRIIFGRDSVCKAGKRVSGLADSILLVVGSASARKSGLLDRVAQDMEDNGVKVELLEGVRSNPLLSKVYEGIELAIRKDIQAVVALGGGSVMDTAKAIAAGSVADHDVWDFFKGRKVVSGALPVVTIPTLAASGSEMNGFMVITDEMSGYKLAAGSELLFPRFSILDPVLTFSVSPYYTACGAVDAVCHILESYFNGPALHTPVTDRMAEGIVASIIPVASLCLREPENYDARAALMWASSLALSGLCKAGVGEHFFPVHLLEHSVSALFPVAHGAGLAALLPGWMRWHARVDGGADKIVQLGKRIFGTGNSAQSVINVLSGWMQNLGLPVTLSGLDIKEDDIGRLADNALYQARIWGVDTIYSHGVMKDIFLECM